MYSDKVRRLVADLPNRGTLKEFTHQARVTNPVCGDVVEIQLRVDRDQIAEVRFQASGCTAALAAAAALTEMVQGQSLIQAGAVTAPEILGYLEGLPRHKLHGPELAAAVLKAALSQPVS